MRHSKRLRQGQQDWLAMLIVVLIGIIILIFFVMNFSRTLTGKVDQTSCKASVLEHAAAHLKIVDLSSQISCLTQNITASGVAQKAKQDIANQMYVCWDQFGKGKLDLFKEDGIYCVTCSWVKFEDKTMRITDLSNYLASTNAPGQSISYLDFFGGYETPNAKQIVQKTKPELLQSSQDGTIFGDRQYAVLFVYARGNDYVKKLFGAASGSQSIYVFGAGVIMTVGGAALVTTGVGTWAGWLLIKAGAPIMFSGGLATGVETWLKMEPAEHAAYVVLREYNAGSFDSLGCKVLPAKQGP